MNRRSVFFFIALICYSCGFPAQVVSAENREFSFFLSRFQYLFVARTVDGYRLTFVTDTKGGEVCRLQFNGFQVVKSTDNDVTLRSSYDTRSTSDASPVELHLMRSNEEYKPHSNHSVNQGHWSMDISGSGERFKLVSEALFSRRVKELWEPLSMQVHGETIKDHQFKEAYVRK